MPRTLFEKLYHSSLRVQRVTDSVPSKCLVEGWVVSSLRTTPDGPGSVPVGACPGISEPTMLSHHG